AVPGRPQAGPQAVARARVRPRAARLRPPPAPVGAAPRGRPGQVPLGPPVRVVSRGTPAAAVPPLQALLASAHEVVAVVTRPDRPRDRRGGAPQPPPGKAGPVGGRGPVLEPPG